MAETKGTSSPPPGHPVWKAPADAKPENYLVGVVHNRGPAVTDNTPDGPGRPDAGSRPAHSTVYDPDATTGPAYDPGAVAGGGGSRLIDDIMAEQFGVDTSGHRWRYLSENKGRVHKTFADTYFGIDPSRFAGDAVFVDRSGDEFVFAWLPVPGGLPMKAWGKRHGAFGSAPPFDIENALGILEAVRQDSALDPPSVSPSAGSSKEARDLLFLAAMRLNIEDAIEAVREGRPAKFLQMNYQPEPAIQAHYTAMFEALSPAEKQAFEEARMETMAKLGRGPRAYRREAAGPEAGEKAPPSPATPPAGGSAPPRPTVNDTVNDTAAQPAKTEPMPRPAPTLIEIPASQVEVISRPAPTVVSGEIVPRERTVITVTGESVPPSSPLAKSSFAAAAPKQLPGREPPALPPRNGPRELPPPPSGPKRLGPHSP